MGRNVSPVKAGSQKNVRSGHFSRHARTCSTAFRSRFRWLRPPAVTPDLIRGPGPGLGWGIRGSGAGSPRTAIRGKPGEGGACGSGPRIKSGVTAEEKGQRVRARRTRDVDGRNESAAVRFEFADRVHDIDPIRSRRRRRHRVDKSRPGRHSRPANAGRECRHLPTRPACRHFRRHGPARKCRPCGRRRVTTASVAMAVACRIVSSPWPGGVPGNGKGRRNLRRPPLPDCAKSRVSCQ